MAIGLGIGLGSYPFSGADAFWRWVDLCEQSQLDSLWQSDRLISQQAFLEPMSMMAALAGATRRIKFGMNAVVLGFRHPVLLAKQCATIDHLSNGRLLPCFGIGAKDATEWNAADICSSQRGLRANESLQILSRLWREDQVDFDGEIYSLRNASINPKPVQANLPLWVGGSSPAAIRRTARYGTGWIAGLQAPEQVRTTIAGIKEALLVENRQIDHDHYGATVLFRFASRSDQQQTNKIPDSRAQRISAIGDAKAVLDLIDQYIEAGASKFVAIPMAESDEDMLWQTSQLIAQVLPELRSRK